MPDPTLVQQNGKTLFRMKERVKVWYMRQYELIQTGFVTTWKCKFRGLKAMDVADKLNSHYYQR